jgi:TPR repeat protein
MDSTVVSPTVVDSTTPSTPPIPSKQSRRQLFKTGKRLYKAKKYEEAMPFLEQAAALGHVRSHRLLGNIFYDKDKAHLDFAKARHYYERELDMTKEVCGVGGVSGVGGDGRNNDGIDGTMAILAYMYQYGLGGSKYYPDAIRLYTQAIELNNALALNNLAFMYHHGQGVDMDYTKAFDLYTRAAAKGQAEAFNNLAKMHENGLGVPRNHTKARELYEEGAAKGSAIALENLGYLYYIGGNVEQDYAKAKHYFEQSLERPHWKNGWSLLHLANIYVNGHGVQCDPVKAIDCLMRGYNATVFPENRNRYVSEFQSIICRGSISENVTTIFIHYMTMCSTVEKLKSRVADLETQISYAPGGDGYEQARNEFQALAQTQTS